MSSTSYRVRIAPTNDGAGSRGPPDLSPRKALERWLDKLRVDKAESTVSSYHYRLKHFVEWCETEGITSIGELSGWDLDTYETHRRGKGVETISLNNELSTLENFLEYCAAIELVDDSLPEKVDPPTVPKGEDVNFEHLETAAAKQLLEYFRTTDDVRYSREHVLLELGWFTGARTGGLRALDIGDYDRDGQVIEFVHRPSEDTPLKNGVDGERAVGLSADVCDALNGYLDETRLEIYDDYGREPLLATTEGRISTNSFRSHTYLATLPCLYTDCPHGRDPDTCEYIHFHEASKCPSSLSPHRVRTGSIIWHLNCGWDPADVAEKVNASVHTIKKHYDLLNRRDKMEKRRRDLIDDLGFNGGEGGDS